MLQDEDCPQGNSRHLSLPLVDANKPGHREHSCPPTRARRGIPGPWSNGPDNVDSLGEDRDRSLPYLLG